MGNCIAKTLRFCVCIWKATELQNHLEWTLPCLGDGPTTASESTVSNTEISAFFGPHRVPGRELSDFLSAYYLLGQRSGRTKVPRIFRIFVPNFLPNFAPNFPRIFRGVFVLCFPGNGDQKKFTKNPRPFSMQNSQANTKKIFTKCFWRAGEVIICVPKRTHQGFRRAH